MRDRLASILALPIVERIVIALILVNAVTLGLETSPAAMAAMGPLLIALDRAILAVFVIEIAARLYVHRLAFFRDPWSVFDLAVVAIAIAPATGSLSVLRALRILRVLRLITVIPSLRRVVGAMIGAIPSMGSIGLLLLLVYYVSAVMATKLFGGTHPELFGSLGASTYTLFQVMTFDDWSGGVAKPILEQHPYAMLFFVPFILLSAFIALNLFIGVIVSAIEDEKDAEATESLGKVRADEALILAEIRALRAEVADLRAGRTPPG
jgi:voltage-gated sodium channel